MGGNVPAFGVADNRSIRMAGPRSRIDASSARRLQSSKPPAAPVDPVWLATFIGHPRAEK
jgi:hypothetical protein